MTLEEAIITKIEEPVTGILKLIFKDTNHIFIEKKSLSSKISPLPIQEGDTINYYKSKDPKYIPIIFKNKKIVYLDAPLFFMNISEEEIADAGTSIYEILNKK